MKKIHHRIYSDFFLSSRVKEYEKILIMAIEKGYEIVSIAQFYDIMQKRCKIEYKKQKYLILRHDIDTDLRTLRDLWTVVRNLKISASYFFRLNTFEVRLMQEMASFGSEASYHYEELATYGKRYALNKEETLSSLHLIKENFRKNIENVRRETKLPIETVASHGDWFNRKVGLANTIILEDPVFREEVKVKLEAYDSFFMNQVDSRHSDTMYPEFWKPNSPLVGIEKGAPVIYLLIHPRNWNSNIKENLSDDFNRTLEGASYRARRWFRK